ncbi:glutaredoxin family protein [Glutamicibacter sp. NPDC087344]|uniref:glutaredoxin family protein n=1 Tax=Glutamicibacter sp. NPDC087344 TaxID=3363994 RepID=UPI00382DFFB5
MAPLSRQVTVYTKDGCGECVRTTSLLNRKKVPFATVHVADDDETMIAALKAVAEAQGVAPSMPLVEVTDDESGDRVQWFGHRPDYVLSEILNPSRGVRA